MGHEGAPKQREEPVAERIEKQELRVQRLLGEAQQHLSRIPNGEQLIATLEGQTKLAKLQDSARRFNERIISAVGSVANFALLTRIFSDIQGGPLDFSPQTWHFISELAAGVTVSAALIGVFCMLSRSRSFDQQAGKVLDEMKS